MWAQPLLPTSKPGAGTPLGEHPRAGLRQNTTTTAAAAAAAATTNTKNNNDNNDYYDVRVWSCTRLEDIIIGHLMHV